MSAYRINFNGQDGRQMMLSNFLQQGDGCGKDRALNALDAFYGSIALAESGHVSIDCPLDTLRERVRLKAIQSVLQLRSQMDYLIAYHHLYGEEFCLLTGKPSVRENVVPVEPLEPEASAQAAAVTLDLSIFDN